MSSTSQILPGFSTEQVASLTKLIKDMIDSAFEKHFGLLPPQPNQAVTMPELVQSSEQKQEQQVIAEDNTESTAESTAESISCIASSRPVNTSLLPTIPRLRTMSTCRESAFYVSNASFLAFFFDFFSASLFASLLGYMRHAEDMEATGQG